MPPLLAWLRATPPHKIAGVEVGVLDLAGRTDALIFTGPGLRVAIRPSGTEPKVKGYIEIRRRPTDDLTGARDDAQRLMHTVETATAELLQRGPN